MANLRRLIVQLLFVILFCASSLPQGSRLPIELHSLPKGFPVSSLKTESKLKHGNIWGDVKTSLIGSVAPTCTYNECRGCKYKCRAEQVPVEGNDPINSAYHYKCVCHR